MRRSRRISSPASGNRISSAPEAMTAPGAHDRSLAQRFNTELGRLRTMLRRPAAPRELVLGQARTCGRYAQAAGHPLVLLVEVLAAVVPDDAWDSTSLPTDVVDAGVTAYETAAEAPTDALLD